MSSLRRARLPGLLIAFPDRTDDNSEIEGVDTALAEAHDSGDWLLVHTGPDHLFNGCRWIDEPTPEDGGSHWRPLDEAAIVASGLREHLPSIRFLGIDEADGAGALIELSTSDHVLLRLLAE